MATPRASVDEIEIDLGRYELRRCGRRVKLERKPMELLILLAQRQNALVARPEIEARLWGPEPLIDTERSINNAVRKIRTALGDDFAHPHLLETVFGKGYRLIGRVRVLAPDHSPTALDGGPGLYGQPERVGRASCAGSSLVVLPFVFLHGSEQQRGLSLGFADALISALGNLERFFVLPTSAVLKYAGDADPAAVASRFGVRFVLQGTIQAYDGRSRISVQIFDAQTQSVTLAQKYDVDLEQVLRVQDEIAGRVADAVNRRFRESAPKSRDRYSRDPSAYAEFMRGYAGSASDDPRLFDDSIQHLSGAVRRDPRFALAHAMLSFVYANKHFEFDPCRTWLERAEFHAERARELDPQLPEAHLAHAYILWGPSKNFQHLEAIAELRRALLLQPNLPHAHNRLGAILAHVGLLEQARDMYEQGRCFEPKRAMSHGITQVYMYSGQYDLARRQIEAWRAESPGSKYPIWFAAQVALYQGNRVEAEAVLREAARQLGEDPLIASLLGLVHALDGEPERALRRTREACESPKSFGHAHHTYYQIACTYAVLGKTQPAMEWLERTADTGFPCWPLFRKDPHLRSLRSLPQFQQLVNSLEEKYARITVGG